ncbi:MAG: hypothetical protein OXC60_17055 [Litoreibacter sp.]|nr:hypothetical protein [Litoreibacter sp.]
MSIKQELDQLRQRFPDCMIAGFTDLSTGMVLSASHQENLRQEHLDALCATGADMLRGDTSCAIAESLSPDPDAPIVEAVLLNPNEVGIFFSAPDHGVDALCCACTPAIPIARFTDAARESFMTILAVLSERKAG